MHQISAVAVLFALWLHVGSRWTISRYCVVASCCCPLATSLLQGMRILVGHRFFCHGLATATFTRIGEAIFIDVCTPFTIRIHAGQYINLWIPGLGFRSFFESHPFIVAAIENCERGQRLKLIVQTQRGWTLRLRHHVSALDDKSSENHIVLFSGPHGRAAPVSNYGVVILAASDGGIVAQLPYLQWLIHSYRDFSARTRRIHLVWQLEHIGTRSIPRRFYHADKKR